MPLPWRSWVRLAQPSGPSARRRFPNAQIQQPPHSCRAGGQAPSPLLFPTMPAGWGELDVHTRPTCSPVSPCAGCTGEPRDCLAVPVPVPCHISAAACCGTARSPRVAPCPSVLLARRRVMGERLLRTPGNKIVLAATSQAATQRGLCSRSWWWFLMLFSLCLQEKPLFSLKPIH